MVSQYSVVRRRLTNEFVSQYTPMVAKLCWKYWGSFPPSIKVWLDIEDLLFEALTHVVIVSMPLYNGKSSVTTFVYSNAEKYLINLVKKYSCSKRGAIVVSVEPADLPMIDPLGLTHLYETRLVLETVYRLASPGLKKNMKAWFCHPAVREKSVRKQRDFEETKQEFLQLADVCRLSRADCQLLLRTGYNLL